MRRKWNSFLAAMCIIGVLAPQAAEAACQRRDLQGLWDIYLTGVFNTREGGVLRSIGFYAFCVVQINARGQLSTRAACEELGDRVNITGQFSIRPGCAMTGEIQIDEGDSVLTSQLLRGTLTRSKEMWTGVGLTEIAGNVFEIYTFSGVKR